MRQSAVLMYEVTPSWGSELVFPLVSIRPGKQTASAGAAAIRRKGASLVAKGTGENLAGLCKHQTADAPGDTGSPSEALRPACLSRDSNSGVWGPGSAIDNVIRGDLTSTENEYAPKI